MKIVFFLHDKSIFISVNTIAVAKPEKAQMVESMLIQMAQTGQIQGKVCTVNIN